MYLSAKPGLEVGEEVKEDCCERLKLTSVAKVHHALASQYAQVCRTPIDGMYVTPSSLEPFLWNGLLFLRKGIFAGGIFRFSLKIPTDFPSTSTLPDVVFDDRIFHPLIDLKTRILDLSRFFPDGWKMEKHELIRVLVVVQRIFFSFEYDCDKVVNPEAAILYKEDKDKFREIARETVESSRAEVYDDEKIDERDKNSIRLTPWDCSVHEADRLQMAKMAVRGEERKQTEFDSKPALTNAAASEFRFDRDARQRGVAVQDLVGKHYPRSYSWFDSSSMTVLTTIKKEQEQPDQSKNEAATAREKYGIEKLDLTGVSSKTPEASPKPSEQVDDC